MDMDVVADIRAPDLATLELYCDRVASAVGRLSVRVFGFGEADGVLLAHHLGRALQLTNILRDIDEDAAIGRLYLAAEELLGAGISSTEPVTVISDPAVAKVCASLVERARRHFAMSDEIMRRNPRNVVRAPLIMSKYYGAILELLVARGFAPPRAPVRLNKIARIASVGCTHFIDDLPEFLGEPGFPAGVKKMLFDPNDLCPPCRDASRANSWLQIAQMLLQGVA